jgi:predicted permease
MHQDLRFALRWIRRHSGLAAAIVLTLGLGIGGATAVFSVVHALLLAPLPFPDAGRLVRIYELTPDGDRFPAADPDYFDLARDAGGFAAIGAWRDLGGSAVLAGAGEPQRIQAVPASASFFRVLGVPAALGRTFDEEEERQSTARPLVLSDRLWRSRFGGAPDAIGRTVTLDGAAHVIAGVMPRSFDLPAGADAWVPLAATGAGRRGEKSLALLGRLAPDTSLAEARGGLRAVASAMATRWPESHAGWSADLEPLHDAVVPRRYREAVVVLGGAVTLLLLLACANVANLLLAQSVGRRNEMRLRAALGAGRPRLLRQLLTESGVLALAGSALGLLVAAWSVDLFRRLAAGRIPRIADVSVDATVLAFAALAGMFSCALFGLAPAWQAARVDLRRAMDEGSRYTRASGGPRHALVIVEVALALVLVVMAALTGATLRRLTQVDVGFDQRHVVAVPIELPASHQHDADGGASYVAQAIDALRNLPGVESAAASATNPFVQFGFSNSVTPQERASSAPPSGLVQAGWRSVTPEFFATLRIPIREGRSFETTDVDGRERVAIVSKSLARRLWPGVPAVGRRFYWGDTTGRTRTIVGVAADIRDVRVEDDAPLLVFVPHAQVPMPGMTALVRTAGGPAAVAGSIRATLRTLAPDQPAPAVAAVADNRAARDASPRFNVWLLASFAAIALALAATGVYAILAFWVSERRRELALRLVLGADPGRTARLVLRRGLTLAVAGIAAGAAIALGTTRLIASLLYGVHPADPLTFAASAACLLAVALLACWLPARRAARIDASAVLRE